MAEILSVAVSDLIIDAENPRLPQPNVGQREAIRELAKYQGRKLAVLASDIVGYGTNPADLMIVMRLASDPQRFVVIEGNRRLTALRALENPDALEGAVESNLLRQLRKLSQKYQENPVDSVSCLVVKDRDESDHWVELRHAGEMGGAGVVPWGSEDSSRFRARSGKPEVFSQALDLLEHSGNLTSQERRKLPVTSFKRLIDTPEVRQQLGMEVQSGILHLLADESKIVKAIRHVVDDLLSKRIKVGKIYSEQQRIDYANKLPKGVVVKATLKSGQGVPIGGVPVSTTKAKKPTKPAKSKPREQLIPKDCVLGVTDPRAHSIETELRGLKIESYPNAVSVMLRVFMELSVDSYVDRKKLTIDKRSKLRLKVEAVLNDLVAKQKLTKDQASPVKRAYATDSFLAASINVMHDYVHNTNVFPAPSDLRAGWNSWQTFMIAVWAP